MGSLGFRSLSRDSRRLSRKGKSESYFFRFSTLDRLLGNVREIRCRRRKRLKHPSLAPTGERSIPLLLWEMGRPDGQANCPRRWMLLPGFHLVGYFYVSEDSTARLPPGYIAFAHSDMMKHMCGTIIVLFIIISMEMYGKD